MGVNIYLKPQEIWEFYKKNPDRLEAERIVIAENTETQYEICVSERVGFPQLIVYRQDIQQYEETVIEEQDCERTAKQLYIKYLFPVTVNTPEKSSDSGKKIPVDNKPRVQDDPDEPEEPPIPDMPDNIDELDEMEVAAIIQELDDEIYMREDDLEMATRDYLEVVLGCNFTNMVEVYGKAIVGNVLDHICEYLAEEHLISVYRPTWITDDETGVDEYVKYPYLAVDEDDDSTDTK